MSEPQTPQEPKSDYSAKPLSLRQNLVLTVKVLAGVAILLSVLWLGSELVAP